MQVFDIFHLLHVVVFSDSGVAAFSPFFSAGAYMQSPPPPSMTLTTSISLLLRPHTNSGLILFAGEEDLSYTADYLELGLQNGHVLLYLQLGTEPPWGCGCKEGGYSTCSWVGCNPGDVGAGSKGTLPAAK